MEVCDTWKKSSNKKFIQNLFKIYFEKKKKMKQKNKFN